MQPQAIRIEYTQMPGKNLGLHIHGLTIAAYESLKGFINRNTGWRDEPEHEAFKRANLFFQSDSCQSLPPIVLTHDTEGACCKAL